MPIPTPATASESCQVEPYPENHQWQKARAAVVAAAGGKCAKCGKEERFEVNHIEPRAGRGYAPGCHHHQSNLEALCHDCHVGLRSGQSSKILSLKIVNRQKDWARQDNLPIEMPVLLEISTIALYLHARPAYISEMVNDGRLKAFRIGRTWLVSADSLREWVESQLA